MIAAALAAATLVAMRIPYNGAVGAIAIDPAHPATVAAASAEGGVFESADGGHHWIHDDALPARRVGGLAFAARGGALVAVAADGFLPGDGGVWVRRDGRWRHAVRPGPGCVPAEPGGIALAPDSGRIYVATPCGIATGSADARRWSVRSVLSVARPFVAIAALGRGRLVAAGPGGIWHSPDDGATWQPARGGTGPVSSPRALAADPRDAARAFAVTQAKHLYETRDEGATWRAVPMESGSYACGGTPFVKAVAGRAGGVRLYAGNGCDVRVARFGAADDPAPPSWSALTLDHADPRDLAFRPESGAPFLATSDGGVHASADGVHFVLLGGTASGLNALQVTSVAAQRVGTRARADLYVATQDNRLWAVRDGAPVASLAWEGFAFDAARRVADAASDRITYAQCGGCANGSAGALLRDPVRWHDAFPGARAPALVGGDRYVQQNANGLAVTADAGATWRAVAAVPYRLLGPPMPATDGATTTVAQLVATGVRADGTVATALARVADAFGVQPRVRFAAMRGIGAIGVAPTAFAWNDVVAVDPNDPAHVLAADADRRELALSTDGGDDWSAVARVPSAPVRVADRLATPISVVSICPDDGNRALYGTRLGRAFASGDGGRSWSAVPGSGALAYATSIAWDDGCRGAWVGTYARGVWYVALGPTHAQRRQPGAMGAGLPSLPPARYATRIDVESGRLEEGERALDPREPLVAIVRDVPPAGTFALAIDGVAATPLEPGLRELRFERAPEYWTLGRHVVSVLQRQSGTWTTIASFPFVVP